MVPKKKLPFKKTGFFPVKTCWGYYENLLAGPRQRLRGGVSLPQFSLQFWEGQNSFSGRWVRWPGSIIRGMMIFLFGLMIRNMHRNYKLVCKRIRSAIWYWYVNSKGREYAEQVTKQTEGMPSIQIQYYQVEPPKEKKCNRITALFAGHGGIWFSFIGTFSWSKSLRHETAGGGSDQELQHVTWRR